MRQPRNPSEGRTETRITSIHNPTIVEIRSLHRRKARREQGAFLVEGVRLVREALLTDARVRQVVYCPELLKESASGLVELIRGSTRLIVVDAKVMRSLSDTDTPQGALAVVDLPVVAFPALDPQTALVLVLDGLRDPGNVGTLCRAAAAAGCTAAITTAAAADAFAPKVVRAAMGAHFRMPILPDVSWESLGPQLSSLPAVYGADGHATDRYDRAHWTTGVAVVIGHEDHGLSDAARQWCTGTVAIPMARGVESLNAAMSGAILLFEAVRQRRRQ